MGGGGGGGGRKGELVLGNKILKFNHTRSAGGDAEREVVTEGGRGVGGETWEERERGVVTERGVWRHRERGVW